MWTVKYDSETLRVDADLFKYGKKPSVFENTRLHVFGSISSRLYFCTLFKFGPLAEGARLEGTTCPVTVLPAQYYLRKCGK